MGSSAAAAAAAKRDREYSEYGAATAIATLNPLLEEALESAYTKGGSATVTRGFGKHVPSAIDVDRNADGRSDLSMKFGRTSWGNLDSIQLGSGSDKAEGKSGDKVKKVEAEINGDGANGNAKAKRSWGKVQSVVADINGDDKPDMKITVKRGLFGVSSLDVDTNLDGKADHRLTPHKDWLGQSLGMMVDLKADGTNDGYVEFKRNWMSNIDKLEFKTKP